MIEGGSMRTGIILLRIMPMIMSCEYNNISGSIKDEKFHE
jgi:hypothetical protein